MIKNEMKRERRRTTTGSDNYIEKENNKTKEEGGNKNLSIYHAVRKSNGLTVQGV